MTDEHEQSKREPPSGRRSLHQTPRMPQPGELFAGRYLIERELGRGGMGVVFQARQSQLERSVAIKVLKPPERIEDDPKFDERFLREAASAAKLNHPNTITIHDFGQTPDGILYIVMEYLEGRDLKASLRRSGVFSPERAVHIAAQVCKSLREAHNMGMVHRDLKPANVFLVERDGDPNFVKVLDFGLVKHRGDDSELTQAGRFVGSPKYTSPEALDRNVQIDGRADIYSLGILLFTMLAGDAPFRGDPMQILTAHLRDAPPPLTDVNPMARSTERLDRIIARCLRKDRDERFQSMESALEALLGNDPLGQGERTTTLVFGGKVPASGRSLAKRSSRATAVVFVALVLGALGLKFGPSAGPSASSRGEPDSAGVPDLRDNMTAVTEPNDEPASTPGNANDATRVESETPVDASEIRTDASSPPADLDEAAAGDPTTSPSASSAGITPSRPDLSAPKKTRPRPDSSKPRPKEEIPEGYKDNPY